MRIAILLAATALACERPDPAPRRDTAASAPATAAVADSAAVAVAGPTLIAFYPKVSQAQVDSSEELSTVFDDFSYHLSSASDSLRKLGFVIVERPGRTLHLVTGGVWREVAASPDSAYIGYVFTGPGRRDRIFYGVMTNSDLVDAARGFLGLASPR